MQRLITKLPKGVELLNIAPLAVRKVKFIAQYPAPFVVTVTVVPSARCCKRSGGLVRYLLFCFPLKGFDLLA